QKPAYTTTPNRVHRPTESSPSPPSTSSTSIFTKPDHAHKTARSGIACSRLRVLSPQPPSGHAHLKHVRRLTSSRPQAPKAMATPLNASAPHPT
ncbi:Hypothetical predicted protein, partial [Pelobates cultripes]